MRSEGLNKSKIHLTLVKYMEYAITKVSTKGQIVIPSNMREKIHTGDEFLIVKDDDRFILKNMRDVVNNLKDDLEFARRTEEVLKRYEKGGFESRTKEEFLKELREC